MDCFFSKAAIKWCKAKVRELGIYKKCATVNHNLRVAAWLSCSAKYEHNGNKSNKMINWDALRYLVPFVQFKKHEKHPLRSVTTIMLPIMSQTWVTVNANFFTVWQSLKISWSLLSITVITFLSSNFSYESRSFSLRIQYFSPEIVFFSVKYWISFSSP